MKIQRATLHMALACYSAPDPAKQVLTLAKRYKRQTTSPRTKSTLDLVINSPDPVRLVKGVYSEIYG